MKKESLRCNPKRSFSLVKEGSSNSQDASLLCFTTDGANQIFAGFALKTPLLSVLPSNPLHKFVPANCQSRLRFALVWEDPFASNPDS